MVLITKTSKNHCAVPTGNFIEELIENNGLSDDEFIQKTGLTDDEFADLREGNEFLSCKLADRISEVLHVPSEWLLSFDEIYRVELAKVNQENASLKVLEYA